MPYVDETSGNVVTRIVYDGAPEAGKTTNLRRIAEQVGERRAGALFSPRSAGRQTEFFDWLEFSGGYIDGRRLRCQLVSVPGQTDKAHYRRSLLESADVIVFVTDSHPHSMNEGRRALEITHEIRRSASHRIGLLVQANKQDRHPALEPGAIASEFELGSDVPVLRAAAEVGHGVMYTFVMAARLALEQARLLISAGELRELPGEMQDAERMLETLLALDAPSASMLRASYVATSRVPQVQATGGRAAELPETPRSPTDVTDTDTDCNPAGFEVLLPSLPDAAKVGAGHIWPPVTGRGYLNAAMSRGGRVQSIPVGDGEMWAIINAEGWCAQTFPDDLFSAESEAQSALMRTARACVKNPRWYDEETALAVYPDAGCWRVWCVARSRVTLRDRLLLARDEAALVTALADVRRVERQLEAYPPRDQLENAISLETVVCDSGRAYVKSLRYAGKPFEAGRMLEEAEALANQQLARWSSGGSR